MKGWGLKKRQSGLDLGYFLKIKEDKLIFGAL